MSRKDFGAKPYMFPQPVLIIASYDEDGIPDAMNAAWGGISEMSEISISISPSHKTTKNILQRKAFTVSMADAKHVAACDYFGIESGNNVKDKIEKSGLTVSKSENVDAPIINELAICLECKLKSYDEKTDVLKGEIVNASIDESVLTDGKVDIAKAQPIAFNQFDNSYHVVGGKVGDAWKTGLCLK